MFFIIFLQKSFDHLTHLDLFNNDICNMDDYRTKVFKLLPNLKYLDDADADDNDEAEEESDVEDVDEGEDGDVGANGAEEEDDDDDGEFLIFKENIWNVNEVCRKYLHIWMWFFFSNNKTPTKFVIMYQPR